MAYVELGYLAQWGKLSSIAMDAGSAVPGRAVFSVESMATCVCDQGELSFWITLVEGWIQPGLLTQDKISINLYLSSFKHIYLVRFSAAP